MKPHITHIILALMLCIASASAQKYYLLQTATGTGGGTHASSSSYTMENTVSQLSAGSDTAHGYRQGEGFWQEYDALKQYFNGTYSVAHGWNMISLPKTVADNHKNVLYPGAISNAFAYAGTYVTTDILANGPGYWLKYASDQLVTLPGVPLTNNTIVVKKGWNLIGSIGSSVSTGSIIQIPSGIVASSFFSYNGGYSVAGSIDPGKGYWVKTSSDGKLVLNAPPAMTPSSTVASVQQESGGLNTLTIETNDGKKKTYRQQLLFGLGSATSKNPEQYEMPPRAPESKLDVRFVTNRYGEQFTNETKELPISIQSNGTPLKISMTMNEQAGAKYTLVEKKNGKVAATHRLETGTSVVIAPEEGKAYALRVEQIPLQYALHQNYPNPFNPTTTILFDLPEAAMVTVRIYDILGQEVVTALPESMMEEGQHETTFNANALASGVYFYRLTATGQSSGKRFSDVRKMMMIK